MSAKLLKEIIVYICCIVAFYFLSQGNIFTIYLYALVFEVVIRDSFLKKELTGISAAIVFSYRWMRFLILNILFSIGIVQNFDYMKNTHLFTVMVIFLFSHFVLYKYLLPYMESLEVSILKLREKILNKT